MKYSDADALPPCEFSAHCVLLLDDLDGPDSAHAVKRVFSSVDDRQDEQRVEELRVHLPTCPTCSATLACARQERSWQRAALGHYLVESEARVPSTTTRIFAVLEQESLEQTEQASAPPKRQGYILPEILVPLSLPKGNGNGNGHHSSVVGQQSLRLSNHWVRNGFALAAAAALIFAAAGVFGHFLLRSSADKPLTQPKSWPSVLLGVSLLSTIPGVVRLTNVYNVDAMSGQSEQLTPPIQSSEEVRYETVSPNGQDMLFHFSNQGQTIYTTLQTVNSGGYVTKVPDDDASNAIWMDNEHILVAHVHSGVVELDIHSGLPVQKYASLTLLVNTHLLFYYAPYLYFQNARQTIMYRSNLQTGERQQLTPDTGALNFTPCIMNPSGSSMYCEAQSNQFSRTGPGLYMVSSDGSGVQPLDRRGALLGFASDHALLFLQIALNNNQVMKLGQTPKQDRVLMKNAAPPTALIGPGDAMLAPDGHGLIVQDSNQNDKSRGVWYDDLTTQTSRKLLTFAPGSDAYLIGWDQLPVKGKAPAPGVTTPLAMVQDSPAIRRSESIVSGDVVDARETISFRVKDTVDCRDAINRVRVGECPA